MLALKLSKGQLCKIYRQDYIKTHDRCVLTRANWYHVSICQQKESQDLHTENHLALVLYS